MTEYKIKSLSNNYKGTAFDTIQNHLSRSNNTNTIQNQLSRSNNSNSIHKRLSPSNNFRAIAFDILHIQLYPQ